MGQCDSLLMSMRWVIAFLLVCQVTTAEEEISFSSQVDGVVILDEPGLESEFFLTDSRYRGRTFADNEHVLTFPASANWYFQPISGDLSQVDWRQVVTELSHYESAGLAISGINAPLRGLEFNVSVTDLRLIQECRSIKRLKIECLGHSMERELEVIAKMNWLRSLDCSNSKVSYDILHHLSGMTELEHLGISHTKATDEAIPTILKLTSLVSLDANYCGFRGKLISELSNKASIKKLNIAGIHAFSDEFQQLCKLKSLESLDVSQTEVTGSTLVEILNTLPLTELTARQVQIKDDDFASLHVSPSLVSLSLDETDVGEIALSKIGQFQKLKNLSVRRCGAIDDEVLKGLSCVKKLKSLNLSETSATGNSLELIEGSLELESLILNGISVTDDHLKFLQNCTSLKELSLDNTQVTVEGIGHLKNCKNLEKLSLSSLQLAKGLADALGSRPNLKVLILDDCQVDQHELDQIITDCFHLEGISFSNTSAGDSTLRACSQLQNLRYIFAVHCHQITEAGINSLMQSRSLRIYSSTFHSGIR